ncbi:MAG: cytochrome c biogenesis protein [Planctomycetota bacterium]|nr:cytochrome c biogenesis protein [Planctomycetota bacterium]
MGPEGFKLLAALFYLAGAILALAGLRWASAREGPWPHVLLGLGLTVHSVSIGVHCARSETHFFTSLHESLWLFSWALAIGYLVALLGWGMRSLGTLLLPLCVALLVVSMLSKEPGKAPPAGLASHPLFSVHVLSAILGYGLFLTACAVSLLYLLEQRLLKRKVFNALFRALPSLEKMERAETLCAWIGFVLFTVAVGTGATMAKSSGQTAWYFEPMVISTWITWLVFLFLVVGRASGRLAGRATARTILIGGALVVCTFLLRHPFREEHKTTGRAPEPAPAALLLNPAEGAP